MSSSFGCFAGFGCVARRGRDQRPLSEALAARAVNTNNKTATLDGHQRRTAQHQTRTEQQHYLNKESVAWGTVTVCSACGTSDDSRICSYCSDRVAQVPRRRPKEEFRKGPFLRKIRRSRFASTSPRTDSEAATHGHGMRLACRRANIGTAPSAGVVIIYHGMASLEAGWCLTVSASSSKFEVGRSHSQ